MDNHEIRIASLELAIEMLVRKYEALELRIKYLEQQIHEITYRSVGA